MFQPSFTLLQLYALAKFSDFSICKMEEPQRTNKRAASYRRDSLGPHEQYEVLSWEKRNHCLCQLDIPAAVARAYQTNPKPKAKTLLAAGTL